MKFFYSFFILSMLLLTGVSAQDIDESQYEHVMTVDVLCEEYKGYARFELPNTFTDNVKYDSDTQITVQNQNTYYQKNTNWFVTQVEDYDIRKTETLFDGNIYSNLIVQNGEVTLPFKNPSTQVVSRVTIQSKDSLLDSITIRANGKVIPTTTQRNGFFTQLDLDEPIVTSELEMKLTYDDVAKISEVNVYTKRENQQTDYGYLYVDNNCNTTHTIYYGTYGSKVAQTRSQPLPVTFPTVVKSSENILYNTDFDSDGILNGADNCPNHANSDQKDIDYNGKGDICQDDDSDSILNSLDNCPTQRNSNQLDSDNDGLGDVCDTDDNRFFEENAPFVYLLGLIIAVIFIILAIKMAKQK